MCASTPGFDLSVELAGVGILYNIEIAPTFCVRLLCLAFSRSVGCGVAEDPWLFFWIKRTLRALHLNA
jgi:hypothetical protein